VRSLNDTDEIYIVGLVLENPSMYLQEICQEVYNVVGKQVSSPTIYRLLARYGFARKIQQVRSIVIRAEFMARMQCYNRDLLVWVEA